MTRHSFLSPEERSEKRFVPSTSLPREKQARATLQRSEAARCLSQENDARRTKKAQSFSLEKNCTLSSVSKEGGIPPSFLFDRSHSFSSRFVFS